jgi:hypothetical protein
MEKDQEDNSQEHQIPVRRKAPEQEVVHYPEPEPEAPVEPEPVPEEPPLADVEEAEVPREDKPDENTDKVESPGGAGRFSKLKTWYLSRKKITIPATVLALIILLFAIPVSRYTLAGLAVKRDLSVQVKDSTTHTPVSGAEVTLDNQNVLTDANGKAVLKKLTPGPHNLSIFKKYYTGNSLRVTLPVLKNNTQAQLDLVATGRQVKVTVTDYIDGTSLSGVNINVADTAAKTDKDGHALLVVPTGKTTQKATLSMDGYNSKDVDLNVADNSVINNDVTLTPAGKVYFFSKRTGKLDLLKANLDGSDVSRVLAASGLEQTFNSSISQSPDWKYVALITRRSPDDATPQLYVLSTDDDKVISVDTGTANFSFQGWSGDNLIYTAARTDLPDWQAGKSKLKSYNAGTGKITQLDQTTGVSAPDGTAYESYAFEMVSGNSVIYAKNWQINGSQQAQQNTLHSINADGQNHKVLASYDANNKPPIYYSQHSANSLYIWQQDTGGTGTFFSYTIGDSAPKKSDIDSTTFYVGSQGYYPSPSGKQILWTEMRDGKNAILIGDQNGGNPTSLGSFSDYLPFGWFSDKYVILSKSNNELYVMSAKAGAKPLKITDYQYTNYYY